MFASLCLAVFRGAKMKEMVCLISPSDQQHCCFLMGHATQMAADRKRLDRCLCVVCTSCFHLTGLSALQNSPNESMHKVKHRQVTKLTEIALKLSR